MIRLVDLLKEITNDSFFNDKLALSFPTIISKDIKQALQGIELWQFAWKEANFDSRSDTFKRYDDSFKGGDANNVIAIKKSDFDRAISAIKNSKMRDKFKTFMLKKPWPEILQFGRFSKFLRDTNSYDKYKTTIDNLDYFKADDITAGIWNKNKQEEFASMKVEGAYYHVSANDNLKPGDIIKPYFDSKEYLKTMLGGTSMAGKVEFAMKVIEDTLEENRPSSAPSRQKTSYVFKTIDDAVEYLHGGDRPIYAVKTVGDVYFVDMKLIDEMNYEINDYISGLDDSIADDDEERREANNENSRKEMVKKINKLAKQYWAKKASSDPVWEGLTKKNIEVIKKVK
jgi:CRISPR/Cas system-associated protein endoribonuclease Cas2